MTIAENRHRFLCDIRCSPCCGLDNRVDGVFARRYPPFIRTTFLEGCVRFNRDIRFPRLHWKMVARILSLFLLVLLVACGATVQRTLPESYETIFIKVADNSTLEYGAEERLTETLVKEFQRDGRLRQVPNWKTADLVLEVDIEVYDLDSVVLNNDNRTAGRDLQVEVSALAREPATGRFVMAEQKFRGSGNFFLSNVPGARREDDVNRRVAKQIIARLLEGWG